MATLIAWAGSSLVAMRIGYAIFNWERRKKRGTAQANVGLRRRGNLPKDGGIHAEGAGSGPARGTLQT